MLPSRPSNRDHAPRPHNAADGASSGTDVSANPLPASSSRPAMVCGSSGVPATSRANDSSCSRAASSTSMPPPPSSCPASHACAPPPRGSSSRACTPATTCSASVRPNRASHARGIASAFSMVPTASSSTIQAPCAFRSFSRNVSSPSSCPSSSTGTETVFSISPTAKVSVPRVRS